jgi:hypothetical protein
MPNCLFNIIYLLQNFMIPKSKHHKSLRSQPIVAFAIVFGLLSVLSAIDFDHDPLLQTHEINNVWTQRMLPTEFVTTELPQAKMAPQETFSVGGIIPQFFGSSSIHAPLS